MIPTPKLTTIFICHATLVKWIRNNFYFQLHDVEYSPAEISVELRSLYLSYMIDIAELFGSNKRAAKEDSQDVLDMFLDLAKV